MATASPGLTIHWSYYYRIHAAKRTEKRQVYTSWLLMRGTLALAAFYSLRRRNSAVTNIYIYIYVYRTTVSGHKTEVPVSVCCGEKFLYSQAKSAGSNRQINTSTLACIITLFLVFLVRIYHIVSYHILSYHTSTAAQLLSLFFGHSCHTVIS